jgi:predicted ferric reductase
MFAATQLWWYTARSTGIVAWVLLTGAVLWGLALSTKVLRGRPRPNWILDLHRFVGGLATIFVLLHIVALLLDTYVTFNLIDVLVPMASKWRPGAVAWGIAGFYLLLAVELTSLARKRLSKKVWRAVHYASFPLFAVVTLHALTAGTDRHTFLLRWGVLLADVLVGGLTFWRVNRADDHDVLTSPRVTRP